MTVRAKFKVDAIERQAHNSYPHKDANGRPDYSRPERNELHTIKMSPVYGNNDPNHENTKFWEASPSGKLELGTVNAAAAAQFELGAEYYIDFIKAD